MSDERKCRVCGCTDEAACTTPAGPCRWVGVELCSACDDQAQGLVLDAFDVEALRRLDPVEVRIDGPACFALVAALQLALRHPGMGEDSNNVAETARQVALVLGKHISVTRNLAAIVGAGWRPELDHQVPIVVVGRGGLS